MRKTTIPCLNRDMETIHAIFPEVKNTLLLTIQAPAHAAVDQWLTVFSEHQRDILRCVGITPSLLYILEANYRTNPGPNGPEFVFEFQTWVSESLPKETE